MQAAGLGAARREYRRRRRELPGRRELPSGGDAVARPGPRADRASDAHPEFVDPGAIDGDIKISGCPNGCGQHHIAAIGFQGSVRKVGDKALPQYFVLVGGGSTDEGAQFGQVVSKMPVRRLTDALDRLLTLYQEQREPAESLGAFFRRVPPAVATDALKDLAELQPGETTADDFIDLGETQAFEPDVMDGECAS